MKTMKTMKRSLVLIALVLVSGVVMATGNLKVNIVPGESDKAEIKVTNATQSQFNIEIKNDLGDVIFYKQTKSPSVSYNKVYDFSKLEDGKYVFTVSLDNEMETSNLDIKDGQVSIVNERKDAEPFVLSDNNVFKISYLNFEKEKVKFYLYDNQTNALIYEKNLENDFAISHGLDYSKLEKGRYNAVLASGNSIYEYNFNKE